MAYEKLKENTQNLLFVNCGVHKKSKSPNHIFKYRIRNLLVSRPIYILSTNGEKSVPHCKLVHTQNMLLTPSSSLSVAASAWSSMIEFFSFTINYELHIFVKYFNFCSFLQSAATVPFCWRRGRRWTHDLQWGHPGDNHIFYNNKTK